MTDLVLTPITTGYNLNLISNNFQAIQDKINTYCLQKSSGNNVLSQDLDMNGFSLLNLTTNFANSGSMLTVADAKTHFYQVGLVPTATNSGDAVNYDQVSQMISAASSGTDPANVALYAVLSSNTNSQGASLLGIEDSAGKFTSTNVEGALAEVATNVSSLSSGLGNTSGFQQSGMGSVLRTFQDKGRDQYSAFDTIPVEYQSAIKANTSTVNVASYISQAASNGGDVYLPPGTYYVTDNISVPSGVRLRGAGRHKTILLAPATFNMSAVGVLSCSGTEPGPIFEDFTIRFVQPDTNIRANLTQYPPAFYLHSIPRFAIRRVRVELAWDGIDMTGNAGGSVIEDYESSCFNTDIEIDGSFDSVKLDKLHVWPFGLTTRADLGSLYYNNLHTGIKCGRCDDFKMSNSIIFSLVTATNFYQSASGTTFGSISNCDFDDRGGLNISAGALTVTGCYFSIGKIDAVVTNISGGSVTVTGSAISVGVLPNGGTSILVTGSGTQVNWSDNLYGSGSLDCTAISAGTGSRLNTNGNQFDRTTNIAYTKPTILYDNAAGSCEGNTTGPKGTGAGSFVNVNGDTKVVVTGNSENGWSYSFPTGTLNNVKFGVAYSCGHGTMNMAPDASGNAVFAHGMPVKPKRVIPVVLGNGGFVHVQFVSADNTNITLNFRDATGAVVTTNVTADWVAFL